MKFTGYALSLCLAAAAVSACSRVLPGGALAPDMVQEGKSVTWPDGRSILVERRSGNRLEKVRLTQGSAAGIERVIASERGEISQDPDGRTVRVTLHDAVLEQGGKRLGAIKEYSIICMH